MDPYIKDAARKCPNCKERKAVGYYKASVGDYIYVCRKCAHTWTDKEIKIEVG